MRRRAAFSFAMVLSALVVAASASPDSRVRADGEFLAEVDFSTFTFTPVGSRTCLLEVEGRLVFTGTLEGEAPGKTTALVFGPCSDVATTPPGTFPDLFRSELHFAGTVDGAAATADLVYVGITREGGAIDAVLVLSNGLEGTLRVDAIVAVGGSYAGFVEFADDSDDDDGDDADD